MEVRKVMYELYHLCHAHTLSLPATYLQSKKQNAQNDIHVMIHDYESIVIGCKSKQYVVLKQINC